MRPELIFAGLEILAGFEHEHAADEDPGLVDDALLRQRVGNVAKTGPVRNVDDTILRQRPRLLEALLARPGAILSRAQLEDKLYGWSDSVESNAVEVHIHALRKKLGADLIRNVRGVGWMVAKPDAAQARS